MKTVRELNQDELFQLRWNYFYDENVTHDFETPYEITDEFIFEEFGHYSFCEEDFSFNLSE